MLRHLLHEPGCHPGFGDFPEEAPGQLASEKFRKESNRLWFQASLLKR
jgi:hypothetical protein